MTRKTLVQFGLFLSLAVAITWVAASADDATSGATKAESAAPEAIAIGSQVADFTFKDIRYAAHTLADLGERKAYVIVFATLDCPVVKRYLPRIVELEKTYRDRGVQFVVMNVGQGDSMVEVAYQAIQLDAPFPFCKDYDGAVVRAVGATRTPQVVVLDGQRRLQYRGRIDSQFRVAGVKPTTGRDDLKEALDDLLADREVQVAETPVDGCLITIDKPKPPATPVTFTEHIAPLMQKHCQDCHRPNAEGPFELLTYQDAVDHVETIAEVVREQRMPPSYASERHGDFVNLRSMSSEERSLLAKWIAGGMQEGDPSKLPAPRVFPEDRWQIGEPDLVLKWPAPISIPATGYIPYKYVILPHIFKEDTWITGCQILPQNRSVLHHCNLAYIDALSGKYTDANFITGQVPGGIPMTLDKGVGFRIPKGSVLVVQIHYVTTGEATTDQSSVGFVFAKEKVHKQLRHFQAHNRRLAIPPHDPHHEVTARRTFRKDATLVGMFSHMHLRGKDMLFNAIYPDGSKETLLAIPNYSFDWQMSYVWRPHAKKFPAGTVMDVVAHYDNSAFNPYNPDANKTVHEGQQTYDEMMYGFIFYTEDDEDLNLSIDPKTGYEVKESG